MWQYQQLVDSPLCSLLERLLMPKNVFTWSFFTLAERETKNRLKRPNKWPSKLETANLNWFWIQKSNWKACVRFLIAICLCSQYFIPGGQPWIFYDSKILNLWPRTNQFMAHFVNSICQKWKIWTSLANLCPKKVLTFNIHFISFHFISLKFL